MSINFRKWICGWAKKGGKLYDICDCQRYEPPDPPEPEVVYVSVCETSGLRTNPYCPVMSIKPFVKGTDPINLCTTHTEPPPPPPVEKDYSLVCSCYNLLAAKGDVKKFIEKIADNGATGCRFFLCETWGDSMASPLQPYKEVGRWSGGYPDSSVPIFNLDQPNPDYWERLDDVLMWMVINSINPHVVFFDHSSRNVTGDLKYYEPFFSSVQRYPNWQTNPMAEPSIPGGLMGQGMKQYHKLFMKKVIDALSEHGLVCDTTFEIWNEFYGWYENGEIWPPVADAVAWFQEMTDYLIKNGVKKANILTSNSLGGLDMAKMSGIYSIHNIGNASQISSFYAYDAVIEFSGDGYYTGKGKADYKGRKCASADELVGLAKEMKKKGYKRYEFFDFGIEGSSAKSKETWCGVWANVDLFDSAPLKAMAGEFDKED